MNISKIRKSRFNKVIVEINVLENYKNDEL